MNIQDQKNEVLRSMSASARLNLMRLWPLATWDYCLKEDPLHDRYWDEHFPRVMEKTREFIKLNLGKRNQFDESDSRKLEELLASHFKTENQELSPGDRLRKFRMVLTGTEQYFRSIEQNKETLDMCRRLGERVL